jgi:hypothetical protein
LNQSNQSSVANSTVSSIRGIRYRGDDIGNSFCCDPADTIDIKATLGPNNAGLAALVFPTDFRAVGTLMVLFVHEARHNNGRLALVDVLEQLTIRVAITRPAGVSSSNTATGRRTNGVSHGMRS